MFGIGGNSLFNIAESAAIGALTGGTGLALESLAGSVLKSAIGEGLTALGSQLGLSQGQISDVLSSTGFSGGSAADTAQSAGEQLGFSPTEQGQIANDAQQTTSAITQMLQQGLEEAGGKAVAHGKGGGMSVLQAIAYAMGKAMDDKLNDMSAKAQQLGNSQSGSSQYGQLSSEISADGQELSMMSSAVSNAIKSIGDAGSQLAKKD